MTKKYIISHSDAEQHSRCEWAHHYGYGYNLKAKKTPEHVQIGLLLHEMLAGYYSALKFGLSHEEAILAGHIVWQKVIEAGKYDFDVCNQVLELYNSYVNYYNPDEWEILWVEEYMEYEVADNIILNGVIDLVVRAKVGKLAGRIGVIDHKSCYNFMTMAEIGTHSQIPKYVFCLNKLGIFDKEVTFGIINQVRWREVKDIDKLFSRIVLTKENDMSEIKQAAFINEYLKQAKRIIPKRDLPDPYFWKDVSNRTTIKDICKYCDYRDLCIEELNGNNPELTMKVYFTKKDLSYRTARERVNGSPRGSEEDGPPDS